MFLTAPANRRSQSTWSSEHWQPWSGNRSGSQTRSLRCDSSQTMVTFGGNFKMLKRMSWPNPPHMWKAVRTGTINKVLRLWQLVTASAQISFEIDPKTTEDGKINPHLPHWIFPSCGALHEPSLSSWFFSDFVCSLFSLSNSWLPPVVVSAISMLFLLRVLSVAFFPSLKSPLCPFLQWISGQMPR